MIASGTPPHRTTLVVVALRVSWTAKKTNEWVLNKAGDTVIARKLEYYGHTTRKKGVAWRKR